MQDRGAMFGAARSWVVSFSTATDLVCGVCVCVLRF